MSIEQIPKFLRKNYEIHEWKHSIAILKNDFSTEWTNIVETLEQFRLRKSWIAVGGGRKSKVSEAIDSSLYSKGWVEKQFSTAIELDGQKTESPTHQVDCFKNRIALEIEWNNKDPFLIGI